jgi:hypothetical protein
MVLIPIYSQLPSISGGRLLHPQPEDSPCYGDRHPLNMYIGRHDPQKTYVSKGEDGLTGNIGVERKVNFTSKQASRHLVLVWEGLWIWKYIFYDTCPLLYHVQFQLRVR